MWHTQCCFLRALLFLLYANVFLNCTGKLSVLSFKDDTVTFLNETCLALSQDFGVIITCGSLRECRQPFLQCIDVVVVMEFPPPPLLSRADPYYKLLGIHKLDNIIIYKFQIFCLTCKFKNETDGFLDIFLGVLNWAINVLH